MNTNKFKSLQDIVGEKCRKTRLPFLTGNPSKSLRDTCLEFCANYFEEVFIDKKEGGNKLSVKKSVSLPPLIFEVIQDASRKIGTNICPHLLKVCLRSRAALNWQNIDLYYLNNGSKQLSLEDLKNIAEDGTPVKKLTYCFYDEHTEESLLYISKFASTLEHLAIGPDTGSSCKVCDEEIVKRLKETKIKMPNLKFLMINLGATSLSALDMMDIDSFKNSVEVLQLQDYHSLFDRTTNKYNANFDKRILIEMIKSCKNLTSLSLSRCCFEQEGEQLLEAITSLKELKSLDLFGVQSFLRRDKFNLDFIASLPKLDNLEISCSDFHWMDRSILDRIHLTFFGAFDVQNQYSFQIQADVIAHGESLEGLLSSIEYAGQDHGYIHIYAVEKLAELLSPTFSRLVTDDEWLRIEQVLMLNVSRNPYSPFSLPHKMMDVIKRPDLFPYWTGDFLAMITRRYVEC